MMKVILYIAQSLDGYVATKDGSVAWLDQFSNGEDYGYKDFIDSIDTVVQGNTTYQQFRPKYPGKNSYVFSKKKISTGNGEVYVKGDVRKFIEGLDEKRHTNIWLVGGPNLLSQFMNKGLIDKFIIFTMPIILKEGLPLFSSIQTTPNILLEKINHYDNGVVETQYLVKK